MNTITTSELEFETVELLPERAALGTIAWSPIGIVANNTALAVNAGGAGNLTGAWAAQAISVRQVAW